MQHDEAEQFVESAVSLWIVLDINFSHAIKHVFEHVCVLRLLHANRWHPKVQLLDLLVDLLLALASLGDGIVGQDLFKLFGLRHLFLGYGSLSSSALLKD